MMHNEEYGYMGMHFGWWILAIVVVVVLVGLAFRSGKRK